MKIQELKELSPSEIFAYLLDLPRLAPVYGRDIIYRHNSWDGILSGTLRWNGAILGFDCVMDEMSFATPIHSDVDFYDEQFGSTYETSRRYYAVTMQSYSEAMQRIRRSVSFRQNVNPGSDFRFLKRHAGTDKTKACRHPLWKDWFARQWPQTEQEPYSGDVIAWFTI
jgi:hypothetical protein